MDMAMLIVTFAATVIAGFSAVAAIVQAKAAQASKAEAENASKQSRSARDDAVRLAALANAEFARQSAALEESNRLSALARVDGQRELVRARATALISIVDRQPFVPYDLVLAESQELSAAFTNLEMAAPARMRSELQSWGSQSTVRLLEIRNGDLRGDALQGAIAPWCWSVRVIAGMIHDGTSLDEINRERQRLEAWVSAQAADAEESELSALDR